MKKKEKEIHISNIFDDKEAIYIAQDMECLMENFKEYGNLKWESDQDMVLRIELTKTYVYICEVEPDIFDMYQCVSDGYIYKRYLGVPADEVMWRFDSFYKYDDKLIFYLVDNDTEEILKEYH